MTTNDKLMPARGVRLEENPLGRSVSMERPRGWRHPWFTTAQWMPKRKSWVAFVVAGFVNGFCPVVRTTAAELREARGTFFGQLVDARTGAAEIEQLALLAIGGEEDDGVPGDTPLDVPLYQNPPVGLHQWRNIGWDGSEVPPLFFQDLGVHRPPPSAASQLLSGGKVSLPEPPAGNRLLRACDVILHQPRTALTSQISVLPGGATGVSNVTQTLGLREASPEDRLRVRTGTFEVLAQGPMNFSGASGAVASNFEEATWDDQLISTVYLLSPPNAPLDAQPDSSWQAFARHATPPAGNGFWNLHWAQPELRPIVATDIFLGIRTIVGLLGTGAASPAVNYITASLNDATQAALNIVTSRSMAGTFWTPTGGGTTSADPAPAAAPATPGLDKAENAAAKSRAAEAARRNRRLDPPFPFEGQKFRTTLLR